MKFFVHRTSGLQDGKPCEEATENVAKEAVSFWNNWTVEINSLDELIQFVEKYGTVIIDRSYDGKAFVLEIYDTWRE